MTTTTRVTTAPSSVLSVMPERTETTRPAPSDAATAWSMTLVEPLLPDRLRFELDEQMAFVSRRRPSWSAAFFGGTLASIVQTLPPNDPWRHLDARVGNITVGDNPPEITGARHTVGARTGEGFGIWRDGLDIVPLVFEDPVRDVALAALSQPLSSTSAALIALSGQGWEPSITAHRAAYTIAVPADDATPSSVTYPEKWKSGAAGMSLYRHASEALRWAIWRRRAYGITDDPYVVESAFRWAVRADRIILKEKWNTAEVSAEIRAEAITDPQVDIEDF